MSSFWGVQISEVSSFQGVLISEVSSFQGVLISEVSSFQGVLISEVSSFQCVLISEVSTFQGVLISEVSSFQGVLISEVSSFQTSASSSAQEHECVCMPQLLASHFKLLLTRALLVPILFVPGVYHLFISLGMLGIHLMSSNQSSHAHTQSQ